MDLRERRQLVSEAFRRIFSAEPVIWVQAPGRVDLMGSHTDYNHGYVLTMSIDRDTWIAARPRADRRIVIRSLNVDGEVACSLDDIQPDRESPWGNYIRGVALILQEAGCVLTGFDGLVHSTIPFSSGLSSSAALEVASAVLFRALGGWHMDPVTMAVLCQKAENEFVGVKCGILDQYTSAMGRAGHAVVLNCRALTSEIAPIAEGIQVVICDTRAKRELTGSEYSDRRAQCEQGVALLKRFYPGITHLRDVSLAQLAAHESGLPDVVARRCRFIIQESQRVRDLAAALGAGDRGRIGALTAESYQGAHDLYEICSPPMDHMIAAMRSAPGVIGARQAGAGFGGCMVAFVESADVRAFVQHVTASYQERSGIEAYVYPVTAAPGAGLLEYN